MRLLEIIYKLVRIKRRCKDQYWWPIKAKASVKEEENSTKMTEEWMGKMEESNILYINLKVRTKTEC